MLRGLVAVLLTGVLAGCTDWGRLREDQDHPGTYDVVIQERDSDLPSFEGEPQDEYPVLLAHYHTEWPQGSTRIVVCNVPNHGPSLQTENSNSPAPASAPDMAPCMPTADTNRGELHVAPEEFFGADPDAVLLQGSAYCYTTPTYLRLGARDDAEQVLPQRTVRIAYQSDGTFLLDGEHVLRPGRALRLEYRVTSGEHPNRAQDDKIVALFDYPGTWLRSRVTGNEIIVVDPPPPEEPPVLVDLPRYPDDLAHFLDPLLKLPGWSDAYFGGFDATWMKGELFAVNAWGANAATIFRASTDATLPDALRVATWSRPITEDPFVGAVSNRSWPEVVEAFLDLAWSDAVDRSRAGDGYFWSEVNVHTSVAYDWAQEIPARVLDPHACSANACVWVRSEEPVDGAAWRLIHEPTLDEDADGLVWIFTVPEATPERTFFHPAGA